MMQTRVFRVLKAASLLDMVIAMAKDVDVPVILSDIEKEAGPEMGDVSDLSTCTIETHIRVYGIRRCATGSPFYQVSGYVSLPTDPKAGSNGRTFPSFRWLFHEGRKDGLIIELTKEELNCQREELRKQMKEEDFSVTMTGTARSRELDAIMASNGR